jgi:hypothetical protein
MNLGFDPKNAVHKLEAGTQFETMPEDFLFAYETSISPY